MRAVFIYMCIDIYRVWAVSCAHVCALDANVCTCACGPTFTVRVGHVHHVILASVQKRQPGFTIQDGGQRVSWETRQHNRNQTRGGLHKKMWFIIAFPLSHRKTWTWPGCCRSDKSHPSCYWRKRLKPEDDGIPGGGQTRYVGVKLSRNWLESKWIWLLYLFCDVEGFAVGLGVDP